MRAHNRAAAPSAPLVLWAALLLGAACAPAGADSPPANSNSNSGGGDGRLSAAGHPPGIGLLLPGTANGAGSGGPAATVPGTTGASRPAAAVAEGGTDAGHAPVDYLMRVVNGGDTATGLADGDAADLWKAKTLSDDPLHILAEAATRYSPDENGGRKCARVRASIWQARVPLKGKAYRDCQGADADAACKPFEVITELDLCADGLPPTKNYSNPTYRAESGDRHWKPPAKPISGQGDKP